MALCEKAFSLTPPAHRGALTGKGTDYGQTLSGSYTTVLYTGFGLHAGYGIGWRMLAAWARTPLTAETVVSVGFE